MKKIIESRFGLASFFVLVNLATLFIPSFLGRLILLIGIFATQVIFEVYYDGLEWKDDDARFNENVKRNLAFNFSKWLTMMNFIYCGLAFNEEINSHNFVWLILALVVSAILMLLYYVKESSSEKPSYINVLIIPLSISIALSIYLNFGTQFIWMPISLFFIGALFGVFDTLLYGILKKWNEILFNKITISTFLGLALIGIISSTIQFWSLIVSVLAIRLFNVFLGVWLLVAIVLFVLFYIVNYINKKEAALALKEKIEAEKQEKKEKAAKIERQKKEKIEDLSRIPTGHPMETFDSDLVFIAKLYNSGELDQNFHFSKILRIPLKNLVSVSNAKRQIVYDQGIIEALKMYNSLYEKSFTDWFLESMTTNFLPFCNFVEEHEDYKGGKFLKEEVQRICQGMVTCYPEFFE